MKLTRVVAYFILMTGALTLGGCAAPARIDQMTIRGAELDRPANPALKSNIGIRDVTGGQETNPMWVSKVSSRDFASALETSLRSAGMYSGGAELGDFAIVAHLSQLDQPMFGASFTVTATVSYSLVNRKAGQDVYSSMLVTPYTAGFADAFSGVERLRLANEGAIRENITKLINELAAQKIARVTSIMVDSVVSTPIVSQESKLAELRALYDRGLIEKAVYEDRQRAILGK